MSLYLDHAATTPLDSKVLDAMMPYLTKNFGNASALYRQGQRSREALDDARLSIAKNIGCQLDEIIFTGGATESNNLALKGVLEAWRKNNPTTIPHVISSQIEHSSVLQVLEYLAEENLAEVTFLPVDSDGIISLEDLKNAQQKNTALVSIMAVNNEVGSIQPISRIGRWCQKNEILFHVDAVQGAGQILVSMEYWKCDMISLSAHKFYGPKGVGCLAIGSGTEICAQVLGGGQERGYRGGTENIAGIVGMSAALTLCEEKREDENIRLEKLQIFGKNFLEKNIEGGEWNGAKIGDSRVKSNISFSIPDISGESLLMRLDLEGVEVSLGSACSAGMMKPSHVLLAIGQTEELSATGLRITMGRSTTAEILEEALEKIFSVVTSLREDQEFF